MKRTDLSEDKCFICRQCSFIDILSDFDGGAIYHNGGVKDQFSECIFSGIQSKENREEYSRDSYGGAIYAAVSSIGIERTCAYDCVSHHGQFIHQIGENLTIEDTSLTSCRNDPENSDQRGNIDIVQNDDTKGRGVNFSSAWAKREGSCLYFSANSIRCDWSFGIFHKTEGPITLWASLNQLFISSSLFVANENGRNGAVQTVVWLHWKFGGATCEVSSCRFKDNKYQGKEVNLMDGAGLSTFLIKNCDFDVALPSGPKLVYEWSNRANVSFGLAICDRIRSTNANTCPGVYICATKIFTVSEGSSFETSEISNESEEIFSESVMSYSASSVVTASQTAQKKVDVIAIGVGTAAAVIVVGIVIGVAIYCYKKKAAKGEDVTQSGYNGFSY
jgi:hypothetical protein